MKLLAMLVPLLGLLAFAAYVWLVVVAFRRSALWGILVLFLSPITAVIFAVKNWEEAKRPFLAYAGTMVAGIGLMGMLMVGMGGMAMMAMVDQAGGEDAAGSAVASMSEARDDEPSGPDRFGSGLPTGPMSSTQGLAGEPGTDVSAPEASAEPVVEKLREVTPGSSSETAGGLKVLTLPPPAAVAARPPAGEVALGDARSLIGMSVKIRDKNGRVHRGTLTAVEPDALSVERHLSGGTLSYEIRKSEVESLTAL